MIRILKKIKGVLFVGALCGLMSFLTFQEDKKAYSVSAEDTSTLFASQFVQSYTIETSVRDAYLQLHTLQATYKMSGRFSYIRSTSETGVLYNAITNATLRVELPLSTIINTLPDMIFEANFNYTKSFDNDINRYFSLRMNNSGSSNFGSGDIYGGVYLQVPSIQINSFIDYFYSGASQSSTTSTRINGQNYLSGFNLISGSNDNPQYQTILFNAVGVANMYWYRLNYTPTNYQEGYNNGYDVGYSDGYTTGFETGFTSGSVDGYNNGYSVGYDDGVLSQQQIINDAYQNGYSSGYNEGAQQDQTVATIFSGILQVALVPVNFFLAIFNFEILGVNISGFITAIFTVVLTIIVVKTVIGSGGGSV